MIPRVGCRVPPTVADSSALPDLFPTVVESTVWPDAQIQASSVDGGVLMQTPTSSTIPAASQAVRVALEREFPSARTTIADPSGSDSDAPLVSGEDSQHYPTT